MTGTERLTYWSRGELASIYLRDALILLLLIVAAGLLGTFKLPRLSALTVGIAYFLGLIIGQRPFIVTNQRSVSWWLTRGQTRSWFALQYLFQILIYSLINGFVYIGYVFAPLATPSDMVPTFWMASLGSMFLSAFLFHMYLRSAIGLLYLTRTSVLYPKWLRSIGSNEKIYVYSFRHWLRFGGGIFLATVLLGMPFILHYALKSLLSSYDYGLMIASMIAFGGPGILYLGSAFIFAKHSEFATHSLMHQNLPFRLHTVQQTKALAQKTSSLWGVLSISPTTRVRTAFFVSLLFSILIFGFLMYDAVLLPPQDQHWTAVIDDHLVVAVLLFLGVLFLFLLMFGKSLLTWDRDKEKQAYLLTNGVSLRTLTRIRIGTGLALLLGTVVSGMLLQYVFLSEQNWISLLIIGVLFHRAGAILFHYANVPIVHPEREESKMSLCFQISKWIEQGLGPFWIGMGLFSFLSCLVLYVSTENVEKTAVYLSEISAYAIFLLALPVVVFSVLKTVNTLQYIRNFK